MFAIILVVLFVLLFSGLIIVFYMLKNAENKQKLRDARENEQKL
jgi:flagellar basal body-associated protein FliL